MFYTVDHQIHPFSLVGTTRPPSPVESNTWDRYGLVLSVVCFGLGLYIAQRAQQITDTLKQRRVVTIGAGLAVAGVGGTGGCSVSVLINWLDRRDFEKAERRWVAASRSARQQIGSQDVLGAAYVVTRAVRDGTLGEFFQDETWNRLETYTVIRWSLTDDVRDALWAQINREDPAAVRPDVVAMPTTTVSVGEAIGQPQGDGSGVVVPASFPTREEPLSRGTDLSELRCGRYQGEWLTEILQGRDDPRWAAIIEQAERENQSLDVLFRYKEWARFKVLDSLAADSRNQRLVILLWNAICQESGDQIDLKWIHLRNKGALLALLTPGLVRKRPDEMVHSTVDCAQCGNAIFCRVLSGSIAGYTEGSRDRMNQALLQTRLPTLFRLSENSHAGSEVGSWGMQASRVIARYLKMPMTTAELVRLSPGKSLVEIINGLNSALQVDASPQCIKGWVRHCLHLIEMGKDQSAAERHRLSDAFASGLSELRFSPVRRAGSVIEEVAHGIRAGGSQLVRRHFSVTGAHLAREGATDRELFEALISDLMCQTMTLRFVQYGRQLGETMASLGGIVKGGRSEGAAPLLEWSCSTILAQTERCIPVY